MRRAVGFEAENGELGPGIGVGREIGEVMVELSDGFGESSLRFKDGDLPLISAVTHGVVDEDFDVRLHGVVPAIMSLSAQPIGEPRAGRLQMGDKSRHDLLTGACQQIKIAALGSSHR